MLRLIQPLQFLNRLTKARLKNIASASLTIVASEERQKASAHRQPAIDCS